MKKLIVIAFVMLLAWDYQTRNSSSSTPDSMAGTTPASVSSRWGSSEDAYRPDYRCDGRQHCSQMGSFEEAQFFLANCPNVKMDGDHDGVPCERQFGR